MQETIGALLVSLALSTAPIRSPHLWSQFHSKHLLRSFSWKVVFQSTTAFGFSWLILGLNGILPGLMLGSYVFYVSKENRKNSEQRSERTQFASELRTLERLLSVGIDLRTALGKLPEHKFSVFSPVYNRILLGQEVSEALSSIRKAHLPVSHSLVAMIPILQRSGSPLVPLFREAADAAEHVQALREKKSALAAQGQMQASVLSFLPALLIPVLGELDPRFAAFYRESFAGAICLILATVVLLCANAWLRNTIGANQ